MKAKTRFGLFGKHALPWVLAFVLAMGTCVGDAALASPGETVADEKAKPSHVAAEVELSADAASPKAGEVRADGLVFRVQADGASAALVGWYGEKLPADAVVPALVSSGGDPYEVRAIGLADDEGRCEPLFEGSGIGSLSVPATVSEIADGALSDCDSLARIVVSDENETYSSFDGMLFSKGLSDLLLVPEGKEGAARIPDQTATVPASVFSRCQRLQAVQAGEGCAAYSSRNGILYTKDMKTLVACPPGAGGAVVVPEGVEAIASDAFAGCSVGSITVLGDVGSIVPDAFDEGAKAAVVALPEGSGRSVWEAAGFTRFAEPARPGDTSEPEAPAGPDAPEGDGGDGPASPRAGLSFEVLDDYTLAASWAGGDAPAELSIPAAAEVGGASYRVSTIAPAGFSGLPTLESVELPAGLSAIGDAAFAGCSSLANVDVPDGVASIGERAFEATALTEAWLSPSVETVGPRAFASCASLARVVALGSPDVAADALAECSNVSVYCPAGSEGAWNPGLPAAGNHVLPYAASLSAEPLALAAGETADLLEGGGLLAPEPVEASYSYPAKPLSVDADGSVSGKSEGAADVTVSLTLDGVELARASRPVEVAPGEEGAVSEPEVVSEDRPLLPSAYLAGERAAAAPISVTAPVAVTFGDGNGYDVANPATSVSSSGHFVNASSSMVSMTNLTCEDAGASTLLEEAEGAPALEAQSLFSLYPGGDASKAVDFGYGEEVRTAQPQKTKDFMILADGRLDCTYRLNLENAVVKPSAADNGMSVKPLVNITCTFERVGFYLKDVSSGYVNSLDEVKAQAEDISANGEASEYWNTYKDYIADESTYECKVAWGDGQTYDVRIIGLNHDAKSDGSGKNAGLTFQFVNLLDATVRMSGLPTNDGGWAATELRSSMNERTGSIGRWVPQDLWEAIVQVEKGYTTSGAASAIVTTSSDKLFIASYSELVGTSAWASSYPWTAKEGSQYEFYQDKPISSNGSNDILVKKHQSSGLIGAWWERSVNPYHSARFLGVYADGHPANGLNANGVSGVCPCFCL